MKLLTLLLFISCILISGCDDDDDVNNVAALSPLVKTWRNTETPPGLYLTIKKLIFSEDGEFDILYGNQIGIRDRMSGYYTSTSTMINFEMFDVPQTMDYVISNDTLIFNLGSFVPNAENTHPDSWVQYLIPSDSLNVIDGDITFADGQIFQAKSYSSRLYKYDIDPLELVDSLNISSYGRFSGGIDWDESGLWYADYGEIKCIELNSLTNIESGPNGYFADGIAWDGTKVRVACASDECNLYSFLPGSDVSADSISLDDVFWLNGLMFLDSYLYVCMESMLYKCETDPFKVVQAYAYYDNRYASNDPYHKIVGVASDGTGTWILVQKSSDYGDIKICKVLLQ